MKPQRTSLVIPLIVATSFFMENLDGTVIATALPQMAGSFGVGPADLSIGMTSYLLTLAVFIPASGWIADRLGARTVFASAIAVFTLASALCGVSQTLLQFATARILQGIGGAMMVPVGRMVVMRETPKPDMMRAIQAITWPGLLAPVLGPPVGGFITTFANWRWIFYLNLPMGVVGILLVWRFFSDVKNTQRRPFDWLGFVLSGAALAGLMYGLDALGQPSANWVMGGSILILSVGLGLLAIRQSQRHPSPLLDLAPAKLPTFAANLWSGSLFRIAINSIPFLVPLLLQVPFGMTAFQAGLLILIGAGGDMAMKAVTTPILRRFGFRSVLVGNGICAVAMTLAFTLLAPGVPNWAIATVLLVYGICRSMQMAAQGAMMFSEIPPTLSASASTLGSMVLQLTLGMGVAFGAVMLHAASWLRGGTSDTPVLGDFRVAFTASAMLGGLAVLGYLRLAPDAGSDISGHRVQSQ